MTDDEREEIDERFGRLEHSIRETQEACGKMATQVFAIETAIGRMGGDDPVTPAGQSGHAETTPRRSFLAPTNREVKPDGGYTTPAEANAVIADLKLELAGARKALQHRRQVSNDRTDERDAARDELERLRLDLEERAERPCESCTYEMWSATTRADGSG